MRKKMRIGARDSSLSRAQVEEIKEELKIDFDVVFVKTTGDLDRKTSLRGLGKSDFFTKELDEMILSKKIDGAIHSAKDLPEPLAKGLKIAYLSQGVDPRDSLVIRKEPIQTVGTSSIRREEAVKKILKNPQFVDLRGTIEERLSYGLDAVVIAEAALIRLHLTHLKRIFLPGPTEPMQGKLALVCHEEEDFIFGS